MFLKIKFSHCTTVEFTGFSGSITRIPELVLENCSDQVQAFVREVDLDIFLACIISAGNLTLLRKVLKTASLSELLKLLWDRVRMGSKARVKAHSPRTMKRMVRQHLDTLETMLDGQPFLFGEHPNAGDFSAFLHVIKIA